MAADWQSDPRSCRIRRRSSCWILSCLLPAVACVSAEIPQHRVRTSKRTIPYRNIGTPLPKFWIPSHEHELPNSSFDPQNYREADEQTHLRPRAMESQRIENIQHKTTENAGQVQGDASLQSPEEWYRLRKLRRQLKKEKRRSELSETQGKNRRAQVDDKFAETSESEPTNAEEEEVDTDTSSESWNVSSQVEYGAYVDGGRTNATSTVVYTTASPEGNDTSSSYQPIRIRAIMSERGVGGDFLNETEREFLFQDVLSPAILGWSAALRVDPVVGNLTVDQTQLYDGETCGPGIDSGLPSVPVPASHFTEGIPDTDLIVYLSLGFVERATPAPSSAPSSFSLSYFDEEEEESTSSENKTRFRYKRKSYGSNSSAFEVLRRPSCSGDYLAAASYCSTDQFDRPTAAMLHICIDEDFFLERSLERDILTVMHELGHALGFNSHSLAHFRRSDGSPITPRDADGDVVDSEVNCTGPGPLRSEIIPLPSEEILQFRTVRGVRVAEIVTPSVIQVVRNHFNCHEMNGAELESGYVIANSDNLPETGEGSCIGDHLEKRLFRMDLMNPVVDEVPFTLKISSIMLAILADSGWYQVDLSRTAVPSGWGRGAGCAFVEETCISAGGAISESNKPYFCNDMSFFSQQGSLSDIHGCSPDLSRKALCSMTQFDLPLPPEYQYFNPVFGSSVGGSEAFLDYCPVYTGFENGLCSDWRTRRALRVSKIEQFGEKNSRCVTGTIEGRSTAFCLPIACVIEDRSLRVKVSGQWQKCNFKGQALGGSEIDNAVALCPDPVRACPTFYCRRDCLGTGGGTCDYNSGKCICGGPVGLSTNLTETNATTFGFGTNGTDNKTDANATFFDYGINGADNETMVTGWNDNSTESENATNASSDVVCDEITQAQGSGMEQRFFNTGGSKSPADDPLVKDTYFPSEASLDKQERYRYVSRWVVVAAVAGGVGLVLLVVVSFLICFCLSRPSDSHAAESNPEETNSPNPDKDKFVASLLVDIRIRGHQRSDNSVGPPDDSLSETAGSLTESDGSEQATLSSANRSFDASDENSSIRSTLSQLSENSFSRQFLNGSEFIRNVFRRRVVTSDATEN